MEIMIGCIDKFDQPACLPSGSPPSDFVWLCTSGTLAPTFTHLEAVASCRTVLMKVVVARVWVRSRR